MPVPTGSSNPIPVLHVITRLIVGGAQENTLYTAAMLPRERYRVDVISGPQTGSEGSLIGEARAQGIHLTILPSLLRQISPLNDLITLWQLTKTMRQNRYTIVHTHSSKAGLLGRLAARLAGIPIIVHTVHGWSFHSYMPAATRRIYISMERWMARFTDALIVVSESDIHKGLHAGIGRPEQYHLIRSAIPLESFDPAQVDGKAMRMEFGIPSGSPVVGCVGRFSTQKNPLDWVRVAARISRVQPEARFLMVGDGPLRQEVKTLLAQEGLTDYAVLPGLRRDVACTLAAMDIFLLTSLWEGLPRVIPQAMAMGLPVVATRADGTSEAVKPGETGYLCNPGDLETLAQRCLELIEDADLRRAMGKNCREAAARDFDIRVMVSNIDDLYRDQLNRLSHSP